MIGIVVVSHSPRLAEAAVELALAMVPGASPRISIAAGGGTEADGSAIIGTDATRVAAAIDELSDADGVLVVMDLGSAVLSAELALEFVASEVAVRLSAAPFVEGLLAAVVRAAGGASLDEVAAEAEGALAPKRGQLGPSGSASDPVSVAASEPGASAASGRESRRLSLRNPLGLHARPAALLSTAAAAGQEVRITLLRTGAAAAAASPIALLGLGARGGDEIEVSAAGAGAAQLLDAIQKLVDDGFGELAADATDPAAGSVTPAPVSAVPSSPRPLGVSPGRVVGPVVRLAAPLAAPLAREALSPAAREDEVSRLAAAATSVAEELEARSSASQGEAREILAAAALMARDPGLLDPASELIRGEGLDAARAVWSAAHDLAATLEAVGGRTAERVADVRDVRDRIAAELLGLPVPGIPQRSEPFVLIARDLAPADTATLDPATCLALVTEEGGPTSHTAIIARSLGIPAVVAVRGALALPEGMLVLVDGETGEVSPDPDPAEIERARATAVVREFDGSGSTKDGHAVALLANIGNAREAHVAAQARAEGVGLFRSEFLFLDRTEAPSVSEQRDAYREVFAAFPGRKVVVRTLDAGADKPLPFVTALGEENPALGVRGLRTSRRRPELLVQQLEAIAAAAAVEGAEVQVMAPMVATIDEAAGFVALCRAAGIARAGVMIETPAAALSARELVEVVDFVSIGTNDLTQYTMAADRQLGDLAELNDPWQPAVLRLVRAVGDAGLASATPVGVCGEAAADPALAAVLVGLGVGSLSMSARAIPRVAERLAALSLDECREMADAAVASGDPASARAAARDAVE